MRDDLNHAQGVLRKHSDRHGMATRPEMRSENIRSPGVANDHPLNTCRLPEHTNPAGGAEPADRPEPRLD